MIMIIIDLGVYCMFCFKLLHFSLDHKMICYQDNKIIWPQEDAMF